MRPILLVLAVALSSQPSWADSYRGYDEVPHSVEAATGVIEIRSYPPRTVAEVTVRGTRNAAAQRGFGELFAYITGGNVAKDKIAMTVPVAQTETDHGWTIRFFMPEGTTRESLPAPDSSYVRLRRLPAERMLVTRFAGRATAARLAEAETALRAHAAANGLAISGAPRLMFYDDPFTLPWNRRNEVGLVLAR
ncbi:SOUL family heme-binding protein [Rhodovulum euryhalinum]|uniref:SOUL heme-binding protein n=1 Tax=Rhodovulum euryhalinum TaxID=35805 RepID=A0A4R2KRJ1_9RHOB|nr:heme-binding protein [Rhodovulum euryhalinum]TCO73606.1 SOUL heme-binding protein [Rhodovulum euryhalinum]